MDNKEVEKILNEISSDIFKSSISVEFKINESEQIVLTVNGIPHLYHLKERLTKKNDSKILIESIKINSSKTKHAELMINFLNKITLSTTNWNEYIDYDVEVNEEVVSEARKELKEHINSLEEIYLIPMQEKIKSLDVDKPTLNKVWKEYIVPKYRVVEKIDSFRSYLTIKKSQEYPYLILSSKTARVLLTEKSTGRFLKVENNNLELSKIKETERIIYKYFDDIKPFLKIKEYIETDTIKYAYKIENSNEAKEYGSKCSCENFYNKRIASLIKIDLIDGIVVLGDKSYFLSSIKDDIEIIFREIDKIFESIFEESVEFLKTKIKSRKEKFNKPYMSEILNLVDEFPLKGITTYVSILSGEKSSKISSNGYDESQFYRSMSSCTKTFIANKIREFIDIGVVCERCCKASFGHYIGLFISEEAKEYIDINDISYTTKDIDNIKNIDSVKKLVSELKSTASVSKAKALLINLSDAEISFTKEDINYLLKFIEVDRSVYRGYEDVFVKSICGIIPIQYKPIFLLNANMTSGVTKKTLKSIYDNMVDIV